MLVACPVVRVRKPESRPVFAVSEELREFLHKVFGSSEQLDESLGIVRHSKPVVPGVSLDVVVRKEVHSFFLGKFDKGPVFAPRVKEGSLLIPHVFVELRTVDKILMHVRKIQQLRNLTDSKVVEAQL